MLVAIIVLVLCIFTSCTSSNSKAYTVGDTYAQIPKYENEMEIVSELVKKLVKDNSIHSQDQNDYETKYQELVNRHNKPKQLH